MAKLNISINSSHSNLELKNQVKRDDKYNVVNELQNILKGMEGGTELPSTLSVAINAGVAASEDVTIASNAAQTVVINGVTLTGGTDYAIATLTVTEIGDNLVAAIKASANTAIAAVDAVNVAGVVTVSARQTGVIGNVYTLAATGGASAGAAVLSGGSEGTGNTAVSVFTY